MNVWLLLALALVAPSRAIMRIEDARENFETVVRTHVVAKSADGVWSVRVQGAGRVLSLTLTGVERATVHPAEDGLWRGLADFTGKDGRGRYVADVAVDLASVRWSVKSLRWLSRDETARVRAESERAAQGVRAARKKRAPRSSGPFGILPEAKLTALDGSETFLPDCDQPKCLTVVVAPWCPHCRDATPMIAAMRDYLAPRHVDVRVVVADDGEDALREYAESFGPETLLDPDHAVPVGGFPHFFISRDGGAIIGDKSGAPRQTDTAGFAAALGF